VRARHTRVEANVKHPFPARVLAMARSRAGRAGGATTDGRTTVTYLRAAQGSTSKALAAPRGRGAGAGVGAGDGSSSSSSDRRRGASRTARRGRSPLCGRAACLTFGGRWCRSPGAAGAWSPRQDGSTAGAAAPRRAAPPMDAPRR